MIGSAFSEIDFSRYGRLFSGLAGSRYGMAVLLPEGNLLYSSCRTDDPDLSLALKEGRAVIHRGAGARPGPVAMSGGAILKRLAAANHFFGWLLVIDQSPGQPDAAGLPEIVEDIADGILKDCTNKMELDNLAAELADRYEELHLLYDLGNLSQRYRRDALLFQELTGVCVGSMDVDVAAFIRPDLPKNMYTVRPGLHIDNLDLVNVRLRGELYRFVASAGETTVINRQIDPRRRYVCSHLSYKILAAPILINRRCEAMLVLLRLESGADFDSSDRRLVDVMADQASILTQNQDLYYTMQQFTEQMAGALIEAVDAKDPYTRGHSDRVNFFSIRIGEEMGLPRAEAEALYWASLLHDIGKIGVPDVVLSKPERLDEDEFSIIKTHSERGYDILRNVGQLAAALPGIRHHHELYCGGGYPFGLEGKAIPLLARIIAVADAYDSMTSSRAYRPAHSHEEAMAELEKAAGSQLDAEIVAAWQRLVAKNPQIIKSHRASHAHVTN